jgi:nicotinamidase/pyrazinamidase
MGKNIQGACKALIVVDMQHDFMPGGALPVADGDAIIDGINACMEQFFSGGNIIVMTQDWHPEGHGSFASAHVGMKPYDSYEDEPGLGPVLWPDHCIQGSWGAEIHERVNVSRAHLILRKGYHAAIDSYSAFLENDKQTRTGLAGFLKDLGVEEIIICGLALDYCVYYTALDGAAEGFSTIVFTDLSRGVNAPEGRVDEVLGALVKLGIRLENFLD